MSARRRLRTPRASDWRGRLARACLALAASAPGCASRTGGRDAAGTPDAPAADIAPGDAPDDGAAGDAADDARVSTCSEIAVAQVVATPGRAGVAYPGSRLRITGTRLDAIDRVTVGAIEQDFTRDGDALVTSVPAMLAVGDQAVTVSNARCMAAARVTISRLVAVARRGSSAIDLLDAVSLDPLGALDLGRADPVRAAAFTLDGASLLLTTVQPPAQRTVVRLAVGGGAPVVLDGPRAVPGAAQMAQGTTVPTVAMLAMPGAQPAGLRRFDSLTGTAAVYAGAPPVDPVSVACSLDGFRGVMLGAMGELFVIDLPFGAATRFTPFEGWTNVGAPLVVAIAEGMHNPSTHLAAVLDDTSPPTLITVNAAVPEIRQRTPVPGAGPRVYFVEGDVVAFDTLTNELIAVELEPSGDVVWRTPLAGEAAAGVAYTATAPSLYRVGALTLRESGVPGGVLAADTLHIVDFIMEPPSELATVAVPGARGLVGVNAMGNPFLVWTARDVVRIVADAPEPANQRRYSSPAASADIELVAIQR